MRREPGTALVLCSVMGSLRELLGARELLRTFVARDLPGALQGLGARHRLVAAQPGADDGRLHRGVLVDHEERHHGLPGLLHVRVPALDVLRDRAADRLVRAARERRACCRRSTSRARCCRSRSRSRTSRTSASRSCAFLPLGLYLRGFTVPGPARRAADHALPAHVHDRHGDAVLGADGVLPRHRVPARRRRSRPGSS